MEKNIFHFNKINAISINVAILVYVLAVLILIFSFPIVTHADNLNAQCAASPVSVTVNQSVSFISSVSGGNGTYNYSWSGACTGNSANCSGSFPAAGIYTANLTVISGGQSRTASCPVQVTGTPPPAPTPLNAYCSASPVSANINQNVIFISSVSGGTGSYIYSWTGACIGNSNNCSKSFSSQGIYTANLVVTSGSQSRSASCPVQITGVIPPPPAPLQAYCSASPISANINQPVTFISSVSGGNGTYNYIWSGNCFGLSSTCANSFANSGVYTANLAVTSGSQSISASCQVQVTGPPPPPVRCSVNTDCGTNGPTGNLFCQGNNVYQNYITYTCNNPGTPSSYCSNYITPQLQTTCTGNQVCSNGSCININTCTPNYQQRCFGNNLYWYDSCGNQQGLAQYCQNGCYNNSCQNYNYNYGNAILNISKTVKNLTTNSGWANSTYASPSDMLMFMITIQNNSSQQSDNVIIRDSLPSAFIYNNQLVVSGTNNNYNNYGGNIVSGINLGTISAGRTVTITYQVQVASAQNFSYGSTTLTNNVYITSSQSGYTPSSSASVIVTRSGVLGASIISTGLTNNFWVDSFFLPLLITLILIWMWRAGMFFRIEKWIDSRRKVQRGYRAEKELSSKIEAIKKSGR